MRGKLTRIESSTAALLSEVLFRLIVDEVDVGTGGWAAVLIPNAELTPAMLRRLSDTDST